MAAQKFRLLPIRQFYPGKSVNKDVVNGRIFEPSGICHNINLIQGKQNLLASTIVQVSKRGYDFFIAAPPFREKAVFQ